MDIKPLGLDQALGATQSLSQEQVTRRAQAGDVDKAVGGFESLMVHEMLKAMWATVDRSSLFGDQSYQADMYQDMFNQAIADNMSAGKGIGLKQYLRDAMEKRKLLPQK